VPLRLTALTRRRYLTPAVRRAMRPANSRLSNNRFQIASAKGDTRLCNSFSRLLVGPVRSRRHLGSKQKPGNLMAAGLEVVEAAGIEAGDQPPKPPISQGVYGASPLPASVPVVSRRFESAVRMEVPAFPL
jgi:hypothetical protein